MLLPFPHLWITYDLICITETHVVAEHYYYVLLEKIKNIPTMCSRKGPNEIRANDVAFNTAY